MTDTPFVPISTDDPQIRERALALAEVGTFCYRLDGTIVSLDQGALNMLDLADAYPAPPLIAGKKLKDILVYVDPEGSHREQVLAKGEVRNYEFRFKTLSGKLRCSLHDSFLVRDPGTGEVCIQVTARNITDIKEKEAKLQLAVHDLEDLKASLTRKVEEATAELARRNRELSLAVERLSVATRAANIGIWDWDIPKNELSWDDSMYRLYNVHRGDFGGAYEAWAGRIHPEDKARVQADIDAALRGEREYAPEFRIVWPDGTVRCLKADSHTLRGPDGKPLRMIGTNIDLTEARLAEQKLRESAQEILESQSNAGLGTWALDLKTGLFKTSEAMDSVYGIDKDYPHTLEGWAAGIHPDDRAAVQEYLQNEVLAKGLDFDREFRIIRPNDKELRWLYVRGKLEYGPDRRPVLLKGTSLDITGRKRAEEALRSGEEKYRTLFETAEGAILLFADGKWIDCNKAAERVFGCTREQILGAHPKQFSPPAQPDGKNSMEEAPRLIGLAYEGTPQAFSWTHCRFDGTPFFAEVNLNRIDLAGKPHIQAIVRDVTGRKQAENALRESEEKFRLAFETGLDAFYWASLEDGRIIEGNRAFETLFGYARGEFVGKTSLELGLYHHPADRAKMVAELKARGFVHDLELEGCRKDGKIINISMSVSRVAISDKNYIIGALKDITARKESEKRQALYLSVLKRLGDGEASDRLIPDILNYVADTLDIEAVGIRMEKKGDFPFLATRGYTPEFVEKERTLCKHSPEGEPAADADGNISLECLCGAVIKGALGDLPFVTGGGSLWLNSTSALTPEDVGAVAARLVSFRGRCVDVGFESLALIPLRTKGRVIGLLHLADHRKNRLSPELVEFLEGLGSSIAVVMQRKEAEDEKARLEEQVRQSQKMESVGRLAGGVAHDFNNLLTAMTGYGTMLLRSLDIGDPRREDLVEMLDAAERGAALTQQLLAFSRKQVLKPVVLDLNASVESTVKMLKRVIGDDIKLKIDLLPGHCLILADYGQIGQVIMNLAVNARDAMAAGGTLAISTRAETPPEKFFAENPNLKPGPFVVLRVSDTGSGMTPEVMGKIFEPFFTTKEKGKGTGLGLPMVYGIVSQSGGAVKLTSAPGKGTTFKLYFPLAAAERPDPEGKQKAPVCGENEVSGVEKILLVEDDEQLRRLGERVLRESGYAVTAVDGGAEALAALEKAPGVKLVITDMLMPGMSGLELSRELAKRGFKGKILLVSGYTEDIIQGQDLLESGAELLPKPFGPDELLCKVRKMLDASGPR